MRCPRVMIVLQPYGDLGGDGEEEEGGEVGAPALAVTRSGRQVKPRRG